VSLMNFISIVFNGIYKHSEEATICTAQIACSRGWNANVRLKYNNVDAKHDHL
jgi:hypothetical protein